MLRAAKILLIAALMLSIGAQWAVLQMVAWSGMAVSYSVEEGSITKGLEKTFDGKNPCRLCRAINKGKESEKKSPVLEAKKKVEIFSILRPIVVAVPVTRELPRPSDESAASRTTAPAHQPPRAAVS